MFRDKHIIEVVWTTADGKNFESEEAANAHHERLKRQLNAFVGEKVVGRDALESADQYVELLLAWERFKNAQ